MIRGYYRKTLFHIFAIVVSLVMILSISLKVNAEIPSSQSALSAAGMSVTCVSADGSGQVISVIGTPAGMYLFLPANANLKSLIFNYASDKYTATLTGGNEVAVTSGVAIDITSYLSAAGTDGSKSLNIRLKDASGSSSETVLHVMQSANIASMFITSADASKGRSYVDASKSNKATGNMSLITAAGATVYSGKLEQIKGRGNTTFAAEKKPYQIKLEKPADLIQTGKAENSDKTWILLANAYDPTLIHNTASLALNKSLGVNAPDYRSVDLYYDGVYRGNYLLCEKVEVGSGRVDIVNLAKKVKSANDGKDLDKLPLATGKNKYGDTIQYVNGVKNPDDITGGYLIEKDFAYYKGERSYFILSSGEAYVIKSPENCSKEMVEYISDYCEEMYQAAANGGTHPSNGKSVWDYIDKSSLAKYYVAQQIVKNADAFASSTYFYKDNGDAKLISGPAWDYDDSYGIREDVKPVGGLVGIGIIETFISLPDFRSEVRKFYNSTARSKAASLSISGLASDIGASQKMNRVLWNNSAQMYQKLGTYEEDVNYMKTFASGRLKALSTEFAGW